MPVRHTTGGRLPGWAAGQASGHAGEPLTPATDAHSPPISFAVSSCVPQLLLREPPAAQAQQARPFALSWRARPPGAPSRGAARHRGGKPWAGSLTASITAASAAPQAQQQEPGTYWAGRELLLSILLKLLPQ